MIDYTYWYRLPPGSDELADRIWEDLATARDTWRTRRINDVAAQWWLYQRDKYLGGLRGVTGAGAEQVPNILRERAPWMSEVPPAANIYKSAIDTVLARLMTEQPSLEVMTQNAGYETRWAAEECTDALNATVNTLSGQRARRLAGRAGLVVGNRSLLPRAHGTGIVFDQVRYRQLFWGPQDAESGQPRVLHYWHRANRAALEHRIKSTDIRAKGKLLAAVRNMGNVGIWGPYNGGAVSYTPYEHSILADGEGGAAQVRFGADQLDVVHSWHLASEPGAEDGRYVITVHGTPSPSWPDGRIVIWDAPFHRSTAPIATFTPFPDDQGIDGEGLGHALQRFQEVVDRTVFKIQSTFDKLGHSKLIVREGTVKNIPSLVALGITVVEVKGAEVPPQLHAPNPVSEQEINWLAQVITWSKTEQGINEMMAGGMSQLGANASGVAQVQEDQRQSSRLGHVEKEHDDFTARLGTETLNVIDDEVKRNPKFATRWRNRYRGVAESRTWADLLDGMDGAYVDLEPVGALGRTQAGRYMKLQEFAQTGALPPDVAGDALMTSPDLRALTRHQRAGRDLVRYHLSQLGNPKGRHHEATPDRHLPFDIAIRMAQAEIQIAMVEGAKPETLERLEGYLLACEEMQAEAAPAPAGPAAPMDPALAEQLPGAPGLDPAADPAMLGPPPALPL